MIGSGLVVRAGNNLNQTDGSIKEMDILRKNSVEPTQLSKAGTCMANNDVVSKSPAPLSSQQDQTMNIGIDTHLAKTGIMNKNNPKLMNLGGQDLETSQNQSVFDMT